MKDARTLAAAALIVVLAGTAQGQTGAAPDQADETEAGTILAPGQAVTPAERPAEPPLAPAEGAPAPAPRPGETGAEGARPDGAADPGAADPGAAGAAEEPAPATVPVPSPGPEAPMQAPAPEEAPGAPNASPVPPPEPEAPAQAPAPEQAPGAPGAAPVPAEDPGAEGGAATPAPSGPSVPEQLAEYDAGLAACLAQLGALGTGFERVDPISDEGGACGIANPVRVSEIVPGVALEPAGTMRCATAAALAGWVTAFVLPASRLLPEGGRLAAIEHGSTYICRRIGGAGPGTGGDVSQHAFGNAVDVMAFRFAEGEALPVEPRESDGTLAEAFQRTARASACLLFTTVLGPGQEDHEDHLHLDIEARSSGYRLCQ